MWFKNNYMREFEVRRAIITPEKKDRPQFLFLGAHTDDDAMARLTAVLDDKGYGMTIGTMTDSAKYNTEDLIVPRWKEALTSGKVGGITEVRRMEAPDGSLTWHKDSGIWFAGELIDDIDPLAIITPHPLDPHRDHKAVYDIGAAVAGRRTPHYTTDTIYGVGKDGTKLVPDIYIQLTEEQAEKERNIYLANESQVTGLPEAEMWDVEAVLRMTQRRGEEKGFKESAVVFEAQVQQTNPIRDIFANAMSVR